MKILVLLLLLLTHSLALAAEENKTESAEKQQKEKQHSFWKELTGSAESITESAIKTVNKMSADAGESYDAALAMSEEQLESFLADIDNKILLLNQLGFDITDVYLNAGFIPDISFTVARVKEISLQQQSKILKEHQTGFVTRYIVKSLNRAYDMRVNGYHVKDVKVRLTITPGTRVHFVKDK